MSKTKGKRLPQLKLSLWIFVHFQVGDWTVDISAFVWFLWRFDFPILHNTTQLTTLNIYCLDVSIPLCYDHYKLKINWNINFQDSSVLLQTKTNLLMDKLFILFWPQRLFQEDDWRSQLVIATLFSVQQSNQISIL